MVLGMIWLITCWTNHESFRCSKKPWWHFYKTQHKIHELYKHICTLWRGFDSKTWENTTPQRVIGYRDWLFSYNFKFHQKVALNSLSLQLFFCFFFTSHCVSLSRLCFMCVVVSLPALGEYFMTFFWSLSFSSRCLRWLRSHQSSWILY